MPVSIINVVFAPWIWFIVWYPASHLAAIVREREFELAEINTRLTEAHEEKAKQMLRMTHELKAPFAALDANS